MKKDEGLPTEFERGMITAATSSVSPSKEIWADVNKNREGVQSDFNLVSDKSGLTANTVEMGKEELNHDFTGEVTATKLYPVPEEGTFTGLFCSRIGITLG